MAVMDAALFEAPAGGDPRLPPAPEGGAGRPTPEPIFNAPWPVLVLTLAIVGGYAIQSRFPLETVAFSLAFSPAQLEEGRWERLVTSLFLHGNWTHALMNAGFGLAFGTPVARFFGTQGKGAALFFVFFLLCGVLSSLGYTALHLGAQGVLVGASGAVSGLMGATARLLGSQGRPPGPVFSRMVLGMGGAWLLLNALIAVIGSGLLPGVEGAAVAWEAHVAGFVAGVLLLGPFTRLAWGRLG